MRYQPNGPHLNPKPLPRRADALPTELWGTAIYSLGRRDSITQTSGSSAQSLRVGLQSRHWYALYQNKQTVSSIKTNLGLELVTWKRMSVFMFIFEDNKNNNNNIIIVFYIALYTPGGGLKALSTLEPLVTGPFNSFLKPSRLPGAYKACAAKYVAH